MLLDVALQTSKGQNLSLIAIQNASFKWEIGDETWGRIDHILL